MSLDSAINAQLQSLKASNPGLVARPAAPPNTVQLPPRPGLPGPPAGQGGNTLSVAIDNLPFRYQLAEADLRDTFQRWGTLQSVQVNRDGSREVGVVVFAEAIDAGDAQRQLQGHICAFDGATGTLAVVAGGPELLSRPPMPPPGVGLAPGGVLLRPPGTAPAVAAPALPPPGMPSPVPPAAGSAMGTAPAPAGGAFAPPVNQGPTANGAGPRPAWCCKIVIQAETLHPEFPTVTKIVGVGNANVEHIRTQTQCTVLLRGRGSSHVEAATGQELMEPMFLWLASDSTENGKAALEMAVDLLKAVYDEHQNWCKTHNLNHPAFLEPQVFENPPDAGALSAAAPPALSPAPSLPPMPPAMASPPPVGTAPAGLPPPGAPPQMPPPAGMMPPPQPGFGMMGGGFTGKGAGKGPY